MSEARIRASVEGYVAAWNERDVAKRKSFIERGCAEDLRMRTPGKRINGRAELDVLIADFQRRRPRERAVLLSVIDVQGHVFRFAGRVEGGPVTPGGDAFDAGACDEDGRIQVLLSFVGAALPSRA